MEKIVLKAFEAFMLFSLCSISSAKIVQDGLWTDTNFQTERLQTEYKVENGIVTFIQAEKNRLVQSATMTWIGDLEDIYSKTNVLLVLSLFSQEDWRELFPKQANGYDYDLFLHAVAQFPAFCGESSETNLWSSEDVCRRELSTILTHMTYESGHYSEQIEDNTVPESNFVDGLRYTKECGLQDQAQSGGNSECEKYHDKSTPAGIAFPAQEDKYFFGRGPLHMKFNGNYGRFSKAYFDDNFNGANKLLNEPKRLAQDEAMAFSSLLWYYMTPHYPRPSVHDVVTGFFQPNSVDDILNAGPDFGTTIGIMAQDSPEGLTNECMTFPETQAAITRGLIYSELLQFFGLQLEDKLGCYITLLTYSGAGDQPSHWEGGDESNSCKLVNYETEFSIYNSEDYKRCVCSYWGDGEIDCKQEQIKRCQWDELLSQTTETDPYYVHDSDVELKVDLRPVIEQMNLASCQLENPMTGDFETVVEDYIAIELVKDNEGNRKRDEQFRLKNFNSHDAVLGTEAPTYLYIASAFDQRTLVFAQNDQISFEKSYDRSLHEGKWIFGVRACIDRRQEELGKLDCDTGSNFIQLTVIDCNGADANLLPQCQKQDLDPVDPDPINPDPVVDPEPAETDPEDKQLEDIEPLEPDFGDEQNSIPYLIGFDPYYVYEVTQGQSLQIELSDMAADDDEGDRVEIKVELSKEQKRWIKFDEDNLVIYANPGKGVALGLSSIDLVLDDSKDQREYVLTLWVLPPNKPLEPIEPQEPIIIPDSESEPTVDKPDSNDGIVEENIVEEGTDSSYTSQDNASGFDEQTLQAFNTFKNRITQRKQQVLPFIEADQLAKLEPPLSQITTINEIGEVKLIFSEDMFLEELFVGFEFASQTNQSSLANKDDSAKSLRHLQTNDTQVDLSSIMIVELVQGSVENSAPSDQLSFETQLQDFDETSIQLKLVFQSPLSVSIGSKPDLLRIRFAEPSVFVSQQTGLSIEEDLVLVKQIPKQFPSVSSYQLAVFAGSTVQVAANTAFLSQFGVTICLAVSLKAMWNLMHVMQVMAYLRLLVEWPANSQMMLQSMHNAITLENIINDFYTSFQTQFNLSTEEQEENEQLQEKDILSKNLALSLGIFGVCLGALVCALLVYFLLKLLAVRLQCFRTVQRILKKKLFYNVWIRYMIESNLKMTHNCVFYLYISGGFDSPEDSFGTILRITILVIIVIWPFFSTSFLYCKRKKLDELAFRQKFISMYNGNKTNETATLTYTSVFCLRRMSLVCSLLALQQHQYWLVLCFNGVQSLYFMYMTNVTPHTEAIHNQLEYFNELCLIVMQYIMVFFISGSQINPELQWDIGTGVMFLVGFVFAVNVIALLYLSVNRLIYFYRIRKARQAFLKVRVRRNAIRIPSTRIHPTSEIDDKLNDARHFSQLIEEIELEDEGYLPSLQAKIDQENPNAADIPVLIDQNVYNLEKPIRIRASTLEVSNKEPAMEDGPSNFNDFLNVQLPKVAQQERKMSRNGNGPFETKHSVGGKTTAIGSVRMNANLSPDPSMLLVSNCSQHEQSFQFNKEKQVCDRECTTELQIEPVQYSVDDFLQMVDTQRQLLPVIPDCTNSIEQSSSSCVSQTEQHENIPLSLSLKQQLQITRPPKHFSSHIDQASLKHLNQTPSQPSEKVESNQIRKESLVKTLVARINEKEAAKLQLHRIKFTPSLSPSQANESATHRMSQGHNEEASLEFRGSPLPKLEVASRFNEQLYTSKRKETEVQKQQLSPGSRDRQTFTAQRNSVSSNSFKDAGRFIVNTRFGGVPFSHRNATSSLRQAMTLTIGREAHQLRSNNLVGASIGRSSERSVVQNDNRDAVELIDEELFNQLVRPTSGNLADEQAAQRRKSADSERGGSGNQESDRQEHPLQTPDPRHQQHHSGN